VVEVIDVRNRTVLATQHFPGRTFHGFLKVGRVYSSHVDENGEAFIRVWDLALSNASQR
jgi:hypothetical protein